MIKKEFITAVCVKCGKKFKSYFDETQTNIITCKKCHEEIEKKETEALNLIKAARKMEKKIRLEEKKKELEGKNPYEVLAQIKLMLHRSKNRFKQASNGWWVSSNIADEKDILKECEEILEAYDIPKKYLIAETLDQKE